PDHVGRAGGAPAWRGALARPLARTRRGRPGSPGSSQHATFPPISNGAKRMTVTDSRLATVSEVIRERSSNLNVDPDREVASELIDELISLAVTAPNHYRTNPWRFVVLTGAARERLGH